MVSIPIYDVLRSLRTISGSLGFLPVKVIGSRASVAQTKLSLITPLSTEKVNSTPRSVILRHLSYRFNFANLYYIYDIPPARKERRVSLAEEADRLFFSLFHLRLTQLRYRSPFTLTWHARASKRGGRSRSWTSGFHKYVNRGSPKVARQIMYLLLGVLGNALWP